MKTAEKNAKKVAATTAPAKNEVRTENRPSIPGKDKNDETPKDQIPAEASEAKAEQVAQAAPVPAATVDHEPDNAEPQLGKEEVKQEEPKAEINYIKPVMNLEQTLKSVDGLHRLSIQRLALIGRINTLEAFEVKLIEENDQLESNPYMGCKLTIKDDKGREFTTNTPNLIRMVTQFIFDACHEKLAEIESNIVFPQTN
ncbi:MAG: hypothetical protein JST50_02610 [Bacteroidetes bacterium]|nr:hypothetical protein [Bacteroidota bacterium]